MRFRGTYAQALLLVALFLCLASLAAPSSHAALLDGALRHLSVQRMPHAAPPRALIEELLFQAQQGNRPVLRGPALRRRLPPAMRSRRPPPRSEPLRADPAATTRPRIKPSEALRLAQRRWPHSVALAVNLRGPVYEVKLKAGTRVLRVLVDANTGRVLR